MSRLILAIDPGASGAIAYGYGHVDVLGMADGANMMADQIQSILDLDDGKGEGAPIVYLEQVSAMPGQGVCSMFTFGKNYGRLEGILAAKRIGIVNVTPQKWMKHYSGIGHRKDFASKTLWKKNLFQQAKRIYPDLNFNLKEADALLIYNYARHQERTNIPPQ